MSARDEGVRKIATFPPVLLEQIEEYRSTLRPIPSEAEAIRQLIRAGLEAERKRAGS